MRFSCAGVFETALLSGLTQGSEYLLLWTTFVDYLRRRIKWDDGRSLNIVDVSSKIDMQLRSI